MAPCVILGSEFLVSKACILDFAEHHMDFNWKQKTFSVYGTTEASSDLGLNSLIKGRLNKIGDT